LGKGKKVNDCTPEQAPQIDLILFDLKRLWLKGRSNPKVASAWFFY
jgi:hypothetical protein